MISEPGEAEVLQLQEVEDPIIKDDEVLIKVEATALNRADTLQRKGLYPPPKGASPYLGLECSGIVEAVGKNVSRWKIGDQVIYEFNGNAFLVYLVAVFSNCSEFNFFFLYLSSLKGRFLCFNGARGIHF